ncbi:hypothetical protein MXAN_4843 [Myxococcus xanthus DK 1622]|uniref:Uncharacterized protein n=1 Tax=Myxococcus xanthus (strain DK1622) TaxID=246197 RepID=Q1D2W9_MYXXD|nr:hypothetical protein MXAN_4843 [Myxococcus xanthus DK 1622]
MNVHFGRVCDQRESSTRGRPTIREEDSNFVALAFGKVDHRLNDDRPLPGV